MFSFNDSLGWIWMLLGVLSGLLLGLGFLKPAFLGGYHSSRRRLLRLGHISFFGMGFLNILFALRFTPSSNTPPLADLNWLSDYLLSLAGFTPLQLASWCLLIAGLTMPAVCAICAWNQKYHRLFCVPVLAALLATAVCACEVLL